MKLQNAIKKAIKTNGYFEVDNNYQIKACQIDKKKYRVYEIFGFEIVPITTAGTLNEIVEWFGKERQGLKND